MSRIVVVLDARGLEPPEPMVRILEALNTLDDGAELHASTDRRPIHLLPLLEQRGCEGVTANGPDGGFVTIIRRKA
ncbi:MAG: DUF2249 domain-containing protein [Limisphaerales bacterium]